MSAPFIPVEEMTIRQIQTAARSAGGDEYGFGNLIEADIVTGPMRGELELFLEMAGVIGIEVHGDYIKNVRAR